jgi:hypothetical protein
LTSLFTVSSQGWLETTKPGQKGQTGLSQTRPGTASDFERKQKKISKEKKRIQTFFFSL